MIRYIVSFKTVVNFFISIRKYHTYTESKQEKLRTQAAKLVCACNNNMDVYIKRDNMLYCRINELTAERFNLWLDLHKKLSKRFTGTEYETLSIEKFLKRKSYISTSMETYQSFSNYYIKLERLYQYALMLAYHDNLIGIDL